MLDFAESEGGIEEALARACLWRFSGCPGTLYGRIEILLWLGRSCCRFLTPQGHLNVSTVAP